MKGSTKHPRFPRFPSVFSSRPWSPAGCHVGVQQGGNVTVSNKQVRLMVGFETGCDAKQDKKWVSSLHPWHIYKNCHKTWKSFHFSTVTLLCQKSFDGDPHTKSQRWNNAEHSSVWWEWLEADIITITIMLSVVAGTMDFSWKGASC